MRVTIQKTTLALAIVLLIGPPASSAEPTIPPASGPGQQQPAAPNLPMTVGQLPAAPVAPPSADQDQPVAGGAAPEQQPQQPAAPPPAVVKDIRPSGQPIILQVSQGTVLQLPSDARTLFVADSGVADVTLTSPAIILVTAKKAGGTALYAMDEAGNILLNKFIEVRGGVSILRGTKEDTGAPPPGPMILQIPLQAAPPPQR